MRKSSLLSILLIAGLVVGLAGSVAFAGPPFDEEGSTVVTLNQQEFASVKETPDDFTMNFSPEDTAEEEKELVVLSNTSWNLQEADLDWDDDDPEEVLDAAFSVQYWDVDSGNWSNTVDGNNGKTTVDLQFKWDSGNLEDRLEDFADLEAGEYGVTVTFTVSAN